MRKVRKYSSKPAGGDLTLLVAALYDDCLFEHVKGLVHLSMEMQRWAGLPCCERVFEDAEQAEGTRRHDDGIRSAIERLAELTRRHGWTLKQCDTWTVEALCWLLLKPAEPQRRRSRTRCR